MPLVLSIAGLVFLPGVTLAQDPGTSPGAPSPHTCVPGAVGAIDHPTGCTDIVLRMNVGGGYTSAESNLTETPVFTLYGDNTAVFRPQPPNGMYPPPGQPMIPLVRATLTPGQVDALLTYALGPGGLADAQPLYATQTIDAPSTTFTVNAAGTAKQVVVQALGIETPDGKDAAARARFSALADLLDSFEEQVGKGNVESAAPYQADQYRGMLTPVFEGSLDPVVAWPWTDLAPDDFIQPTDNYAAYAGLTPGQVALVTPVPSGGIMTVRVATTDGREWYLSIRPLLPDEGTLPEGVTAP